MTVRIENSSSKALQSTDFEIWNQDFSLNALQSTYYHARACDYCCFFSLEEKTALFGVQETTQNLARVFIKLKKQRVEKIPSLCQV
jgi:hypothetical protein